MVGLGLSKVRARIRVRVKIRVRVTDSFLLQSEHIVIKFDNMVGPPFAKDCKCP